MENVITLFFFSFSNISFHEKEKWKKNSVLETIAVRPYQKTSLQSSEWQMKGNPDPQLIQDNENFLTDFIFVWCETF